MSVEPEYIGIDNPFTFSCHPGVECFNLCCCDVNQFLYPYDILRLKNRLSISSGEFLEKYTVIYSGDTTGLPIVSFRTNPQEGNPCPFVGEKGCTVYEDRPSSCRIFPLARAISRSRATGEITEHFALIKDPVCQGFDCNRSITVREWITDQDLAIYNAQNDKMIELISLKQQIMPGPLPGPMKDKFILALYNIDLFREKIRSEGLVTASDIGAERFEEILRDDVALLETGLAWIRKELFGKR
jgi:Fe-S-cluster containining protein